MKKLRLAQNAGRTTQEVAALVQTLSGATVADNGTFDSAAATDFAATAMREASVPEHLGVLLDEVGGQNINVGGQSMSGGSVVFKAILDGVEAYTLQHGEAPSADVVEAAIFQAYATTNEARGKLARLDSVSAGSDHHDATSMQPNRAVVAILGAISEAIPVASYLTYDIGSNEARQIVVGNVAGKSNGQFVAGDLMDGIQSGSVYLSTARVVKLSAEGKAKITATMSDAETCVPDGPAVKLLRGRTMILVQGLPVGGETSVTHGATSPLGGSIKIGSTEHVLSGIVKPDTGEIEATFTPALPANMAVHAQGFIDLEKMPELTPVLAVQALKFEYFASPWRALTELSIDSRTQFQNEVGISPETHSVLAIRNQFGNERHYQVLQMAELLGLWNTGTYEFNWGLFGQDKTRSEIAQDIMAALYPLEQKMANDTMDHGMTHLYVDELFAGILLCCNRMVFEPSGVAARPTVYRLGRLLNKFEVYVNPRARKPGDDPDVSKIVCIGRSTQAARNPFVLGDAVAPMAVPISTGNDMKNKSGFYARNFTDVNKHQPSALGCAILTVTKLTKV